MSFELGTDDFAGMQIVDSASKKSYTPAQNGRPPFTELPRVDGDCPFCHGGDAVPRRVFDVVDGTTHPCGWSAAALHNKFPYDTGEHKLVICSPHHDWAAHEVGAAALIPALQLRSRVAARMLESSGDDWAVPYGLTWHVGPEYRCHLHIHVADRSAPLVAAAVLEGWQT